MNILKTKKPEPVKALTPAAAAREAEAALILARRDAELREIAAAEKLKEMDRQAALNAKAKELEARDKAERSKVWAGVVQTWTARFVPFLPLVLVNTVAIFGQLGWGRENLDQVGNTPDDLSRWAIALLFAATLESIALFLAYYANRALNRGDSATALYLGAFGVAALVAMVNYSHYASPLEVDRFALFGLVEVPGLSAMAVVCALCSLASPWLWRIKHRDVNRDKLHALGVIDAKAVRLSMASKVYYPIRSFQVVRKAVWDRETNPIKAVENWEAAKASKAEAKRAAKEAPKSTETTTERVDEAEAPAIAPAPVAAITAPPVVPLPPEAATYSAAWEVLHKTTLADNPISQRQLATNYLGKNRHHARAVIAAYRKWKEMTKHAHGASHATP